MSEVRSFPPVAAADARILILGSMPGVASLTAGQYYAHPRNAFWPILGTLLDFPADAPYAQRLDALKAGRVALWDVLAACIRPGSLDSAIDETSIVPNDFGRFLSEHPQIDHLFFNGAKAADSFRRHVAQHLPPSLQALPRSQLPSTSPANASYAYAKKLQLWRAVTDALHADTATGVRK